MASLKSGQFRRLERIRATARDIAVERNLVELPTRVILFGLIAAAAGFPELPSAMMNSQTPRGHGGNGASMPG